MDYIDNRKKKSYLNHSLGYGMIIREFLNRITTKVRILSKIGEEVRLFIVNVLTVC